MVHIFGFLGAGLGLMVLVALAGLLYVCMNSVPQGYVQMAFEEEKQGPGLFWVTIPAGAGVRLGLLLDAPDGINQPPMIKEVLAGGAVQRYNNSNLHLLWSLTMPSSPLEMCPIQQE